MRGQKTLLLPLLLNGASSGAAASSDAKPAALSSHRSQLLVPVLMSTCVAAGPV